MYTTDPGFQSVKDLKDAVAAGEIIAIRYHGQAGDILNGTGRVTLLSGVQCNVSVANGSINRVFDDPPKRVVAPPTRPVNVGIRRIPN